MRCAWRARNDRTKQKQGSRVQERGCTVHALCRTRTYDPLIKSQLLESASIDSGGTCDGRPPSPDSRPDSSTQGRPEDADLRRLVGVWPELPTPMRVGIMAMISAAEQTAT
jgi:hypothetical protein